MSEIPVIEVSIAPPPPVSRGRQRPWEIYSVKTTGDTCDQGYDLYAREFETRAKARKEAKKMIAKGYRGVRVVHLVLPPMEY